MSRERRYEHDGVPERFDVASATEYLVHGDLMQFSSFSTAMPLILLSSCSPLFSRTRRQLYNGDSGPGRQQFNVASAFAACNGKRDGVFVFIFCDCPASNVVLCFLEHAGSCLTLTVFLSGSGLVLWRRSPDGGLNLTNGWRLRQGFGRQQF